MELVKGKPTAIIGEFSSSVSMVIQDVVKYKPLVQISSASTSMLLSDTVRYPYFFRTIMDDSFTAYRALHFIKDIVDWTTLGIITDNSDYRSYRTDIMKMAPTIGIEISADVVLGGGNGDSKRIQEGFQTSTRIFFVVLHSHQIERIMPVIHSVAAAENVDERDVCFIFTETVFSANSLPSIVNGSFAITLKQNHGHAKHFHARMKEIFENVNKCSSNATKSRCDCLKRPWKNVFLDSNTCTFPTEYNQDDMYLPFSYDAVLTLAKTYHDILASASNAKITSCRVVHACLARTFTLSVLPEIYHLRIVETETWVHSTHPCSIRYFQNGDIVWKNRGTLYQESGQIKCKTQSQLNCLETFKFSTVDGSKPRSSNVFCLTNQDCLGAGTCKQNGYCRCETEGPGPIASRSCFLLPNCSKQTLMVASAACKTLNHQLPNRSRKFASATTTGIRKL